MARSSHAVWLTSQFLIRGRLEGHDAFAGRQGLAHLTPVHVYHGDVGVAGVGDEGLSAVRRAHDHHRPLAGGHGVVCR
jgi:hypothetical protein